MILELNSADWPVFCERLSQRRVGSIVKIETLESDGVRTERISSAVFEGVVFDPISNPCNDLITFRLSNSREILYQIIEPIHIKLHASKEPEDYNPIQIEAENGTTYVTLHPAIHAPMLEGLKMR